MPNFPPLPGNGIAKQLGCPCRDCTARSVGCRSSCLAWFKYEIRKQIYYAEQKRARAAEYDTGHKRARTSWLKTQQKDSRRKG